MQPRSLVLLATALLGTSILGDCGSSKKSTVAEYFPCSLLTAQEVSAALGEKVQQVQPVPPVRCRYLPENPVDFITVKAEASGAQALFEGSKLAGHLMGVKPSHQSLGIGDDSFWVLSVIWVRKGDAYFNINMVQAPVDQQAVGLKLARIAASRL